MSKKELKLKGCGTKDYWKSGRIVWLHGIRMLDMKGAWPVFRMHGDDKSKTVSG